MSLKSILKQTINTSLDFFDLEIKKKYNGNVRIYNIPSCIDRLEQLKKISFSPNVIFDGGAFKGEWSIAINKIFPKANIVLFEPNPYVQDLMQTNIESIDAPTIVKNIALGDKKKELSLNIWEESKLDVGASLLGHVQGGAKNVVNVEVDTLDNISKDLGLIPDLVKLDLQGTELSALHGASNLLKTTELFIIEFGCLDAYEGRTTPRDLIDTMYANDFCLYDIVDLIYRPFDGAFTGGDFFFMKNWSKHREHKGYE